MFDTNKNLEYTYDMFSKYTGKVNNKAIAHIFQDLKKYINFLNTFYENSCNIENISYKENKNVKKLTN